MFWAVAMNGEPMLLNLFDLARTIEACSAQQKWLPVYLRVGRGWIFNEEPTSAYGALYIWRGPWNTVQLFFDTCRMSNTDNFDLGIASLSFFLHLSTSQWMPAVGIASPSFWHFLAFFWDEIHPARSGVPYPALQEEVPELGGDGAGQEGPSGGGLCSLSLLVLWLNCDRTNRPFLSINSKKGWNSTHRYT